MIKKLQKKIVPLGLSMAFLLSSVPVFAEGSSADDLARFGLSSTSSQSEGSTDTSTGTSTTTSTGSTGTTTGTSAGNDLDRFGLGGTSTATNEETSTVDGEETAEEKSEVDQLSEDIDSLEDFGTEDDEDYLEKKNEIMEQGRDLIDTALQNGKITRAFAILEVMKPILSDAIYENNYDEIVGTVQTKIQNFLDIEDYVRAIDYFNAYRDNVRLEDVDDLNGVIVEACQTQLDIYLTGGTFTDIQKSVELMTKIENILTMEKAQELNKLISTKLQTATTEYLAVPSFAKMQNAVNLLKASEYILDAESKDAITATNSNALKALGYEYLFGRFFNTQYGQNTLNMLKEINSEVDYEMISEELANKVKTRITQLITANDINSTKRFVLGLSASKDRLASEDIAIITNFLYNSARVQADKYLALKKPDAYAKAKNLVIAVNPALSPAQQKFLNDKITNYYKKWK